jgi:hypothetical protein
MRETDRESEGGGALTGLILSSQSDEIIVFVN